MAIWCNLQRGTYHSLLSFFGGIILTQTNSLQWIKNPKSIRGVDIRINKCNNINLPFLRVIVLTQAIQNTCSKSIVSRAGRYGARFRNGPTLLRLARVFSSRILHSCLIRSQHSLSVVHCSWLCRTSGRWGCGWRKGTSLWETWMADGSMMTHVHEIGMCKDMVYLVATV